MSPEGFTGRQVVTEADIYNAICDYMIVQLDGRFRVEFADEIHKELIDVFIEGLRHPLVRLTEDTMRTHLLFLVSQTGMQLTECMLDACPNEVNNKFMREFVNLVWDARHNSGEWLRSEGIVPGQSVN